VRIRLLDGLREMKEIWFSLFSQARLSISTGVLMLVFSFAAQAEQFFLADQHQSVAYGHAMASWKLSNLSSGSQGQVIYIKEGTLTRQYELQADAESTSGASDIPSKARFHLTMDVFSPAQDMGMQKKGKYYVQGLWELTGEEDPQQSVEGALTGTIQGRVQAELTFDPTTEDRDWKGIVQIPMSRVRSDSGKPGVRPMRGGGELAFVANDGGSLALDMKLWPKF